MNFFFQQLLLLCCILLSSSVIAEPIKVGSKDFTEQKLLQELTTRYLRQLGYDVRRTAPQPTRPLRRAQELGHVDLYWEYTGTALTVHHHLSPTGLEAMAVYERVRALDAERGLQWLHTIGANNSQTLALTRENAQRLGIKTLSDLSRVLNSGQTLTLAASREWLKRADGWPALQRAYGLELPKDAILELDANLTYIALHEQEVDLALVYTTDGRINAYNLVPLADDRASLPTYWLAPVIRTEVLQAHPALPAQLDRLVQQLDTATLIRLNERVDVERLPIDRVALDFLADRGFSFAQQDRRSPSQILDPPQDDGEIPIDDSNREQ